jgi:hypothetical protein
MRKLATVSSLITFLTALPAYAGAGIDVWNSHVIVDGTSANGKVVPVHRTGSTNEYIYCQTQAVNSGTTTTHKLTCEAQSPGGNYLKCERTGNENDTFINIAGMINKTSEISFQTNAQGICTTLFIQNFSYNLEQVW